MLALGHWKQRSFLLREGFGGHVAVTQDDDLWWFPLRHHSRAPSNSELRTPISGARLRGGASINYLPSTSYHGPRAENP